MKLFFAITLLLNMEIKISPLNKGIFAIADDGRYIAYDDREQINLYDIYNSEIIQRIDHINDVSSLAFNHTTTILAIGSHQSVLLYNLENNTVQYTINLRENTEPIYKIQFSPNDKYIAFSDYSFWIWDLEKSENIYYDPVGWGNCASFQFSSDSKTIWWCDNDHEEPEVKCVDLESQTIISEFGVGDYEYYGEAIISPDCNYFAFYGYNDESTDQKSMCQVHNNQGCLVADLQYEYILEEDLEMLENDDGTTYFSQPGTTRIIFHPNEKYILCAINNGDLQVWNLDTKEVHIMKNKFVMYNIQVSPDGRYILYTNNDSKLCGKDISNLCCSGAIKNASELS